MRKNNDIKILGVQEKIGEKKLGKKLGNVPI